MCVMFAAPPMVRGRDACVCLHARLPPVRRRGHMFVYVDGFVDMIYAIRG